jgi:hypothetical protein
MLKRNTPRNEQEKGSRNMWMEFLLIGGLICSLFGGYSTGHEAGKRDGVMQVLESDKRSCLHKWQIEQQSVITAKSVWGTNLPDVVMQFDSKTGTCLIVPKPDTKK